MHRSEDTLIAAGLQGGFRSGTNVFAGARTDIAGCSIKSGADVNAESHGGSISVSLDFAKRPCKADVVELPSNRKGKHTDEKVQ